MAQAVLEGNSHFYVTLDGVEGIFDFALPGLIEIVGYREGDTIEFTYISSGSLNVVQSFGAVAAEPEPEPEPVPEPTAVKVEEDDEAVV